MFGNFHFARSIRIREIQIKELWERYSPLVALVTFKKVGLKLLILFKLIPILRPIFKFEVCQSWPSSL